MVDIKHINGSVLYTAKNANDVRTALEAAVQDRANLIGAHLVRANLIGANLTGANLDGANLDGAYLTRAYLTRANLIGAHLVRANLDGANLAEAYLTRANLTEAYLIGANLTGAYLTRANLTGANLDGASLDGANLDGAAWAGVAPLLRGAMLSMNDKGRHWLQGELSKPLSDGTIAYCSIGSVEAQEAEGTTRALALWLLDSVCGGSIVAFNDHPSTTWADVQVVFSVAIKHAERFAAR